MEEDAAFERRFEQIKKLKASATGIKNRDERELNKVLTELSPEEIDKLFLLLAVEKKEKKKKKETSDDDSTTMKKHFYWEVIVPSCVTLL